MSVCEGSGALREEGFQNTRRVSGCPGFSAGERHRWRSGLIQSWPWLEGATGRRAVDTLASTRVRGCTGFTVVKKNSSPVRNTMSHRRRTDSAT